MAALRAGVMDPLQDYVNCNGAYWIRPNIRCTGVHGNVNYITAMARSCNTYFQEMGRRASKDVIIEIGEQFGLGQKTNIDLPDEVSGLLPTSEWKKEINTIILERRYKNELADLEEKYNQLLAQAAADEEIVKLNEAKNKEIENLNARYEIDFNFNTNWQQFDTFNMSIGQGYNNFTAVQLANYVSTIANGGQLMKPFIVDRVVDVDNNLLQQTQPQILSVLANADSILPWTKRAMAAVTEPGGTAYSLFANFPNNIEVAAKTGTAETGRAGDNSLKEVHGVFVAFAPVDDPVVAFAGIIEYGSSGSGSAGLVCKAVFEQYFGVVDHLNPANNENAVSDNRTIPSSTSVNEVPLPDTEPLPDEESVNENPEETEAGREENIFETDTYEPQIIIPDQLDLENIRP
jgi:penicillin-binding protein 2